MKQRTFEKFINKEKNSRKKEAIRQEKRKWKQERNQRGPEDRVKNTESRNKKYRNNDSPGLNHQSFAAGSKRANAQTGTTGFKPQSNAGRKFKATENSFKKNTKQKNSNIKLQAGEKDLLMPLNKFIAYSGICGRREAALLVKEGKIKVNNNIIFEPGFKVSGNEKIVFNSKLLHLQKNLVYILLNKPKDYITTQKDEHGRKTVFDLITHATRERVFPVGRLDRNTTGVLLLTNDGDLTQKLTHPSFEVKKIYEVKLNKPLQKKDLQLILNGIHLEDGFITADDISFVHPDDKVTLGIEIHSGRNRIVRRIFEHLGYDVKALDRVLFANLTKKNLERGKWRFLNEKEIRLLKFMNQGFIKKKLGTAISKNR